MKSYLDTALIRIKVHFLFVCVFLTDTVKGIREVTQTAQFILNGWDIKAWCDISFQSKLYQA